MMKCVPRQEELTMLHKLHYDVYGANLDVGLYRRLQRLGIFWPKMANDTKEEQWNCKTYYVIPLDQTKVLNGKLLEKD